VDGPYLMKHWCPLGYRCNYLITLSECVAGQPMMCQILVTLFGCGVSHGLVGG